LRFDSFATEAGYVNVDVYDGTSANGTLKGTFSGPATPPTQTATSGSMFIRFTSDSIVVAAGVSMTWLDAMPTSLAPTSAPTLAPSSAPTLDGIPPTAAASVGGSASLCSHGYM
jgi:hypothetical protein